MAKNKEMPVKKSVSPKASAPVSAPESAGTTQIESAEDYQERISQGLQEVATMTPEAAGLAGWEIAAEIVKKVRPVPWLLWNIIHSVYGRATELGQPDPMMFTPVNALLLYAAGDKTFDSFDQGASSGPAWEVKLLSEAVEILGEDVSAAVCLVHAVCRRISKMLPERVWRPILDDALLRARIGYYVGTQAPVFGAGRGLIAGFAGRCGLAVQVASGDTVAASKALTGLASGKDMSKVCNAVYGCDPLQVAAVSLISAGCNHDIALGIATYNSTRRSTVPSTVQARWLAAFDIVENLRMGRASAIAESTWRELEYDETTKEYLHKLVSQLQRSGHGWRWMVKPFINMENEAPPKSPKELREEMEIRIGKKAGKAAENTDT